MMSRRAAVAAAARRRRVMWWRLTDSQGGLVYFSSAQVWSIRIEDRSYAKPQVTVQVGPSTDYTFERAVAQPVLDFFNAKVTRFMRRQQQAAMEMRLDG